MYCLLDVWRSLNRGSTTLGKVYRYLNFKIIFPNSKFSCYLGLERLMMFKHVKKLGVVYLQQHASNLSSQVWVHTLDQWEQTFTQHLLLLLWWGSGQHCCSQRLLPLNVHSLENVILNVILTFVFITKKSILIYIYIWKKTMVYMKNFFNTDLIKPKHNSTPQHWKCLVSFMFWPLDLQYPLQKKLGGHNRHKLVTKFLPCQESNPGHLIHGVDFCFNLLHEISLFYMWFRCSLQECKITVSIYLLDRWLGGNWHGLWWVAHVCRVFVVGWAALC